MDPCAEPDDECCEGDSAEVGVGPFLVACGDGAEAFETIDGSLNCVALLVAFAVEPGGAATAGTAVASVSALVESFGDGVRDAASSQVAAVFAGCVGLVGHDMLGPAARPPDPDTRHGHLLQDGLQLGAVTVVAWCQEYGERSASSVGCEVGLGGEAAAGTSQALADLTTSSSRRASFRSTGST